MNVNIGNTKINFPKGNMTVLCRASISRGLGSWVFTILIGWLELCLITLHAKTKLNYQDFSSLKCVFFSHRFPFPCRSMAALGTITK